jgi:hypothetical protein
MAEEMWVPGAQSGGRGQAAKAELGAKLRAIISRSEIWVLPREDKDPHRPRTAGGRGYRAMR